MDIEEVVQLDPADTTKFTSEHKTFLDENKNQLTTDELIKFGYTVESVKPAARSAVDNTPPAKKDGEEEPDEEAVKIQKAVSAAMEPERKRARELQDKVEVDTFIVSNPAYGKYRTSIEAHVKDPVYANVPVDRIAKMVAADDLMKIGARAERAAAARASSTANPGNGDRKSGSGDAKNWLTASKEDFEAKKREIMGR